MDTFSLETVIIVALAAFIIGIFVGVSLANQSFKASKEREPELTRPDTILGDLSNEQIRNTTKDFRFNRNNETLKLPEIKHPIDMEHIIFPPEDTKKSNKKKRS